MENNYYSIIAAVQYSIVIYSSTWILAQVKYLCVYEKKLLQLQYQKQWTMDSLFFFVVDPAIV